jgi:NAD+ synthase
MMDSPLKIDAERTMDRLSLYLQRLKQNHSTGGILLGLSGGIDSSLLATILVEALGRQSVHLVYLFDQYSSREQYRNASVLSDHLGIEMEIRSIEPAMRAAGVYSTFGMKITSFSGRLNRLLYHIYRMIFNENPFISSLKTGLDESVAGRSGSVGFRRIIRQPEEGMNRRHRYRREMVEEQARSKGWLPIGAANRTEWQVGWFVKDGIDDLPIQPIKGLYKTQVRQLATYLELPAGVLNQLPSPDMVKGITDEFALGMSYIKIDLALDYLVGGLTKEEVIKAGCSEEQILRVREMNRLSTWKRGRDQSPLPVDGGPEGSLRIKPS